MNTPKRVVVLGCLLALGVATASARQVVRTPSERVQTLRGQIGVPLQTEGIDGRFVERLPGSYAFASVQATVPLIPVANPDRIAIVAVGPTVRVKGRLNELGYLEVESYQLKNLPLVDKGGVTDRAFAQVLRVLDDSAQQRIEPQSSDSRGIKAGSMMSRVLGTSIDEVVDEYMRARESKASASSLSAIVTTWAELRERVSESFPQSSETKAMYGALDNYPPWTYDRIFRQAPAVVAVGEPGKRIARCSGVLLAPDLVLTAAHCFSGPPAMTPTSLEVWFDFAESADGVLSPIRRVPITGLASPEPARLDDLLQGRFDAELLDYAIVRIQTPEPPTSASRAQALCLRQAPLNKGDAVYVLGYPRGEAIKVHDSARVYLPYRVTDGREFNRLRLDVEADLLRVPDRGNLIAQFDSSYRLTTVDGVRMRVLNHVRDGGQPRMGIVADTFHGNSGGPVYDRERSQCVVGILVAGSPDTGVRRVPNWKEHERVLPIVAVLDDLKKRKMLALINQLDVR